MQNFDKHAQDTLGIPALILMENAGANAARIIHNKHINLKNKNIIIFCGTGNNAGDGLVFARHAKKYGANVTILLIKPELRTDETKTNHNIIKNLKIPIITTINHKSGGWGLEDGHRKEPTGKHLTSQEQNQKYDIAIDAILGIGLKGIVKDPYKTAIETFNNLDCTKISLQQPGLHKNIPGLPKRHRRGHRKHPGNINTPRHNNNLPRHQKRTKPRKLRKNHNNRHRNIRR